MSEPSTIGVRADWRCAHCPATARTHQLAHAGDTLRLPHGWQLAGGKTICGSHTVIQAHHERVERSQERLAEDSSMRQSTRRLHNLAAAVEAIRPRGLESIGDYVGRRLKAA